MPSVDVDRDGLLRRLKDVADRLRIHSITSTSASNSGHPTSCCSMAEIVAVLFFHTMRYKVNIPKDPSSDRFILSKGHAAPILYAAWAEVGLFPIEDLNNLRKVDSDLEGHPTPRLNFVDVATGSLGQGLSVACGMAYVGKYFDNASYRVYCVVGDGESAEGSIWEALSFAGIYKLDNLTVIFDVNRLGQTEATPFQHNTDVYEERLKSFGFHAYVIDGHDVEAICDAFHQASLVKDKPTAIVAKTYKGRGIVGIENADNWHGKPLGDKAEAAIVEISKNMVYKERTTLIPQEPSKEDAALVDITDMKLSSAPNYKIGQLLATRHAYRTALIKLGRANERVVVLDGDTKNATFSDGFREEFPDRFVECYVAEQNMVGVAIGCACRGRTVPFCSTFAAFFSRAFDQLRMAAVSRANIKCVGSHAGISIGLDGPSQMGLEDIAMFRAIPTATVFYPSDAVSCERAVELAANIVGIVYIRASRPITPVLYPNDEVFQVGKCKVIRRGDEDRVLIIASGITLHESLSAADILAEEGINVRVVDPFTIKPIDEAVIRACAAECHGRVITVEDHYPEGGIGDAVAAALALTRDVVHVRMAVESIPRSGQPSELLEMFGISAKSIVKAVRRIITL